ncbi:hypothetical protein OEZ86_014305 [Tetradesmus obliquus]|nr:hypothetical protein OEZ86_014305 [Tetradesmus obliquus]
MRLGGPLCVAGDDLLSMSNPCSQWAAGSAHQNVDGLYAVPSPGCLQYVSCKQGTPDGPVLSCAPGQIFSIPKQDCIPKTNGYCMSDAVAAAGEATAYINQNSSTPQLGNRKLMQPAQNATPAYLDPSNWYMMTKYEPFDVNRVSKWMNITPEFPISAVQYYKVSSACYPQELCVGSPKFQSNYYGTQLISVTTTFYECEQGKIWDGKSSCMPGASPYTGTDTSAYVDVPGLVSSGDKQKALPCSSMDGVVRAALIANPQATFALRDSSDPSVKPTFFTVKNADAVVASEEVQEIVMEYFDTRVFDFTNVTVFNWTQDISQSTRKIISKQTRLIQRPNGVSTLVRQLSADGLCWFGIATNSSDAPKTPDEAQRAVTQEAVAEMSAMLPAGSGTAPDLADGTFALSRVLSKETVLLQGLYAPFTMTGDLVVNGVLVSAHSDWYLDRVMPQSHVHRLPAIYQATMAPARLAYRLGGAPVMEFLDSKLHLVELASAVSL